jgi:hypothetical protein
MSQHTSSRRVGFAGLITCLTAGTLLLAPAPAQAGVLDTPASAATVSVSNDGTCTQSGIAPSVAGTFAADGVPVQATYGTSGAVTKTGNPADVTNLSTALTSTIKATQAGGALKTVDVSASFQTSVSAALGTAQTCNTSVQPNITYTATLDLPSARYATFDIDSKHAIGAVQLVSTAGIFSGAAATVTYGHGQGIQRVYIPAGSWQLVIQAADQLKASTPTASFPASKAASVTLHMSLDDPGTPITAETGDGSKYLELAAGRNCAAGALTATWKSKAGKGDQVKIKKAVFTVNGAKVATVKKPKKGKMTTLTGLDPDRTAEVSVTLKLVKKGAGSATVERSYLPCT